MFSNEIQPNKLYKYSCDKCQYYSHKKSNYDEHLLTRKHKMTTILAGKSIKSSQIQPEYLKFTCINCEKTYKDYSGLWRHKKKCFHEITNLKNDLANEEKQQQLVEYLLKENSEFKQLMLEQNKHMIELAKNAGHNTSNNSHNTTNNSFNLQFYLNETCKDAMNIMDFVSQLQVGIKDLEESKEGRICRRYLQDIY